MNRAEQIARIARELATLAAATRGPAHMPLAGAARLAALAAQLNRPAGRNTPDQAALKI